MMIKTLLERAKEFGLVLGSGPHARCDSIGPLGDRCERAAGHSGQHLSSPHGAAGGGVSWR